MGQRGRKSTAELSVIRADTSFKPNAPPELSEEAATEWRHIVSRMPTGWFSRENEALLTQYCRHVVAARRVAQLIATAEGDEEFNLDDYDRLLKMQERESRACASLSTKLRLSPSTRMRADKAAREIAQNPGGRLPPWEL